MAVSAHCHGPDAVMGQKRVDLRRLTLRYGDGAHNMFWKTVHEGRPAKGMPTWKGVFTDEQFEQIYAFLFSLPVEGVSRPGRDSFNVVRGRSFMRMVMGGALAAILVLGAPAHGPTT